MSHAVVLVIGDDVDMTHPAADRGRSALAAGLVASVAVTLVRAAVVAHLWQWYVADPFGAPRLGVAETAGLLLLLMFAAAYLAPGSDRDTKPHTAAEVAHIAVTHIGVALFALLFGLVLAGFR